MDGKVPVCSIERTIAGRRLEEGYYIHRPFAKLDAEPPTTAPILWTRRRSFNFAIEVVRRLTTEPLFRILPRRWMVERTFDWMMRWRRLVLAAVAVLQVALGIATLLAVVPIELALPHQALALVLFGPAVVHLRATELEQTG
jgi:heme A synthase